MPSLITYLVVGVGLKQLNRGIYTKMIAKKGGVNPIYIYCPVHHDSLPEFNQLVALCGQLTAAGYGAWVVPPTLYYGKQEFKSENILAPVLTNELIRLHYSLAIPPVVIYPAVVRGNPLNAQLIARWLITESDFEELQGQLEKSDFSFFYQPDTISSLIGRITEVSEAEVGFRRVASPDALVGLLYDFAGNMDYLAPVTLRKKIPFGKFGLAVRVFKNDGVLQLFSVSVDYACKRLRSR